MAQYSPEKVNLTFAGIQSLTGWESINVMRDSDNFEKNVAADGTVSYTKIADKSGTMEITTQQQASEFSLAMSAFQSLIDANPEEEITVDCSLIDPNGGNVTVISGVRLNKMADQNFETTAGSRTYTFFIDRVDYVPVPEGFDEGSEVVANANAFLQTIASNAGL